MKRILSLILAISMLMSMFCLGITAEADNSIDTAKAMYDGLRSKFGMTASMADTNVEDRYEVTLTVGGDELQRGVDIIYVVGSYATNADGTPNPKGDVLISSLMDAISEIVEAGIPVNFAMVPFSSDSIIAMPSTKITKENISEFPTMIADALKTCKAVYDGVNMENALVKCKKLFSESELKDYPERQHLVMISSGFTYFFNSGSNNENVATVPVNYTGVNRLFFWNKAWQRARTNQTNTYPIPKGIVEAYNKTDKTNTLWEFYWSYIDQWAKADIAAGDKVVYDACTIESGNFINWFNSGELVPSYSQTAYGKAIPAAQVKDINNYVTLTAGADPITNTAAAHAISYERAMWEAYEYAKANIIDFGINFYPIYNALSPQYTNGCWADNRVNENGNRYNYNITWTNQYIGHSFVDMLAGGEGKAVKYDKKGDKAFFDPIKEQILYTVAKNSKIETFIGFDDNADTGYNFDYVVDEDGSNLTLMVGDNKYDTTKLPTPVNGATASYTFTAKGATEPTFWLDYYQGNGTTTEKYWLTFGENVSMLNPISITYTVDLVGKNGNIPGGIFSAFSVRSDDLGKGDIGAYLHPVDSEGNKLGAIDFVPYTPLFVNYEIPAGELIAEIRGTKVLRNSELYAGQFSFQLIDKATGAVVQTTSNDAEGNIVFRLTYERPGEFTYIIKEVIPEFTDDIAYDDSEFTVDVTARYGTPVIVDYHNLKNTFKFTNVAPKSASATISGTKYLDGQKAGGFTFVLTDRRGNVIDTAVSGSNGKFSFATMYYNSVGTHTYYVHEVIDESDDTISYDTSEIKVEVTVKKSGTNFIARTSVFGQEKIAFYNTTIPEETTTPPETTEPEPETTEPEPETTEPEPETTEPKPETTEPEPETTEPEPETTEPEPETTEPEPETTEPEPETTEPETTEPEPETTEPEPETTEPEPETTEPEPETTEPEPETTEPEPETTEPEPETTEPEPEEEITEDPIPLDPAPKTGDNALIIALAAIATISLGVVYFKRRQILED